MGDVERIAIAERYAELLEQLEAAIRAAIIESRKHNIGRQPALVADAVLPVIERERVRVVEGLVASIKALPDAYPASWSMVNRAAVLAVVEAAREDADETHLGWEGRCTAGHVHRTTDAGGVCECGAEIRYQAAREDTT